MISFNMPKVYYIKNVRSVNDCGISMFKSNLLSLGRFFKLVLWQSACEWEVENGRAFLINPTLKLMISVDQACVLLAKSLSVPPFRRYELGARSEPVNSQYAVTQPTTVSP